MHIHSYAHTHTYTYTYAHIRTQAGTLKHIVSQLDIITKTLGVFEQRLTIHESKVNRLEARALAAERAEEYNSNLERIQREEMEKLNDSIVNAGVTASTNAAEAGAGDASFAEGTMPLV